MEFVRGQLFRSFGPVRAILYLTNPGKLINILFWAAQGSIRLSATKTIHQVVPFLDTAIVFLTEELLSASQLHIEVIVSEVDCEFSELLELSPSGLWRRWGQLNSKTRFLWIHTSNSCSWPGC